MRFVEYCKQCLSRIFLELILSDFITEIELIPTYLCKVYASTHLFHIIDNVEYAMYAQIVLTYHQIFHKECQRTPNYNLSSTSGQGLIALRALI